MLILCAYPLNSLLFFFKRLLICASPRQGGVAEWSCSGLQLRGRRFDSDLRLQSWSSPGGEIGRHRGFKIPRPQSVPVRVWPRAPF